MDLILAVRVPCHARTVPRLGPLLTSMRGVLLAIRLALFLVSNLGAMVKQETGSLGGRYPMVMNSSLRISATLGLLAGSCCSSLWMRFLASGPTLLGMWYSFFLILVYVSFNV